MTKVDGARHWIDKNLWAIMAVGLGLYGGYLTGQATMKADIEVMKRDIAENAENFKKMHPPMK